ncbi:winged helix-turn-helix domain-containing protein [Xanthomonas campestris pv. campestris]|uniref:Transcriptional regulator n=1 Tax=Xanthomonas campestris pv. campestris (strain B100) TaxID=509169 RepID=A0A1X7QEN1_XANCB|nr:winged helix-turn-helix domain-containing protein [Xanthomonas campestris]AKS14559.1 transcriptional regulator [Xanthomonas campestris pv. campestris]AKS18583.1 transcriptional regulator [Xanthomonas campestris pv. campestris]ALE67109.1 transcriptional regulator [Xanthomonas campestris pv. campestris]MCC3255463.1 winged helix-turn-helix domain-containing protein [Xanthomonas campestris pv. armoraciae]MCC5044738.1 winged helix-turn-helix domain-containing protein [Xanthomonas campestris]
MSLRSERVTQLGSVPRFRLGPLLVEPERLMLIGDGERITLEPRMMEVLVALAERAGEVISAEQLLIDVWHGSFYGDNPVHKTIAQLRRKLGDDSRQPRFIETIRKRGYRLLPKVIFPEDYRGALPGMGAWGHGSPYVGLRAFDPDHAEVFFGRSHAIAQVLAAVRAQLQSQRALVLLSGASGCGKTSLLRAGVVPLLAQPGGLDGLQAVAVAYCSLAACRGGDVADTLTRALAEWAADGRAVFSAAQMATCTQWLTQPAALHAAIAEAMRHAAPARETVQTHRHLLLVIDHAEALVATPGITAQDRAACTALLQALCSSAHVAVLMATRSDFYPRLIEAVPELVELKRGDGHVDLLPPRDGEIGQIIRVPAAMAGLRFEEDHDSASRLDDVLRDATARQPDALPLLQHLLQALHERRSDDGLLTFAAYRALGGLEGALAHHAEQTFRALPAPAQAALGDVLTQVSVIHPDSAAVTARRAVWSALPDASGARALVDAFVQARLFVSELVAGEPGFAVAHEALLRQWPRASEWIHENRRLLQARKRLQLAAQRWASEGRRDDHLLNSGRPLSEAREAARRMPQDLDALDLAFLHACERAHRQRRGLYAAAAALLVVLASASLLLGWQARQAQQVAEQRRDEAQQLVGYMLGDLAEQLRTVGNLKLLDSVGTRALRYLEELPNASMQAGDLINHARALRTTGEVLMNQGKLDQAHAAFTRAAATAAQARTLAPDVLEAHAETGQAAYWLGAMAYRNKQFPLARRHWAQYLAASEWLVRAKPDDPRWQLELSYALNNLAMLATTQGNAPTAIGFFARDIALKRVLVARTPDNASLRYELIDSLSGLSLAQENQGLLAPAEQGYREQLAMLRVLVDKDPDAHAWRRRLAGSLIRTSNLALARGHLVQAQQDARESLRLLQPLAALQPDNVAWRRDLAHSYAQAGWVAALDGHAGDAAQQLARAQHTMAELLQQAQPLPEWQWLDAIIALRMQAARAPPLAQDFAPIVARLETLHRAKPDEVVGISALAQALVWHGEQRAAAGDDAGARTAWQRALAVLGKDAGNSRDKNLLDPWIRAHVHLGQRTAVTQQLGWLYQAGYRHPGFVSLYAPLFKGQDKS